ncbi:MAG: tetraether lipid synthase Tes, partial [Methanomassiliicoccales archaeon]
MLIQESELDKGLPKKTQSVCPECGKIITADIFEKDGRVLIEKECPEHGKVTDVYWSDSELFLKAERMAYDGVGVSNPKYPEATQCPMECGLCNLHKSHTSLANLDLTNRCNMNCPICFANANATGYVFEPSYEEVVNMMQLLREERPVPCTAIQFSGGEPTVYPRLFDVIRKAKEMGFAQVQIATNGVKLANDPEFAGKLAEAGLNTIYLQFDGLREEIYINARGRPMLDIKRRAIENVRALERPPSIVLVPTIVNGINQDQVGPILEFAIENSDVIRGVNFQPVAFTGRIDREQREKERYTLTDMVRDVGEQTGYTTKDDWYPVPAVAPISSFVSSIMGEEKVTFTAHPHCGLATYLFIHDGKVIPLPRFIDVEKLFTGLFELSERTERAKVKFPSKVKALNLLKSCIDKEKMPEGLSLMQFLKMMESVFSDETKEGLAEFSWNMLFVGGMHFQDNYNYDIERVKRCVIHYVTPDMRIIPFCAYNGGPTYRNE